MIKNEKILDIFYRNGMMLGRLISFSKSLYRQMYPGNEVYFNANIIIQSSGKVWYGDIDVTFDRPTLQNIANELNEPLYVLREMDARFENEDLSVEELVKKAVAVIEPNQKNE